MLRDPRDRNEPGGVIMSETEEVALKADADPERITCKMSEVAIVRWGELRRE